ncbi:protein ABHD11 [Selaginella moellendorffii]|nr:protein ABHD11 [Selaginella moellendorffii]XP_024530447.1 protein ABHD11 [Selaginella moellendorffii]|eukprot:XP_002969815.2 protein ABHD11 [Selaginella moellendorffii]
MARRAARLFPGHGARRMSTSTLAFEEMEDNAAHSKEKTVMFLHGLLGSARNWRGFAKRLQSAIDPAWRIVMVDLRNHGQSGELELSPPHDIPAAARDVADLIRARPELYPDVLVGHSMGGKVTLEFAKSSMERKYGSMTVPRQLWVLDSVVGEVPIKNEEGEVESVLETIRTLPQVIPSRRWLVERMQELGFSKGLANWLGSNLKAISPGSEESKWVFNFDGAYSMFTSYRKMDYWSLLENPPAGSDIGIVRAGRSDRWTPEIIARLEELSRAAPDDGRRGSVTYRVLENAGHWVHADNPEGLLELLLPSFQS